MISNVKDARNDMRGDADVGKAYREAEANDNMKVCKRTCRKN